MVELAEALNQLADRINDLLVAERARVGDLSHRLRTPSLRCGWTPRRSRTPEVAERLQEHVAQLCSAPSTPSSATPAARSRHTMPGGVRRRARVVADRMAFWSALAEDQGGRVRGGAPDRRPMPVRLDAADLTDVLDVLVDNVFAHTPGRHVAFSVRLVEVGDSQAVLEVADEGPGLPPDGDSSPTRWEAPGWACRSCVARWQGSAGISR